MKPNQEVLSRVLASSINVVAVPVLTPQEIRAEIAKERREAVKARDLDRRTKRQIKRSQCY